MTNTQETITELATLLPAPGTLPAGTPRYPNLWLHLDLSAVVSGPGWAREVLRSATGIVDDLPERHGPEGSNEWGRRRELEPVQLAGNRGHDHQLHMRIYHGTLGDAQWVSVADRRFWRIAVSVHYEVDRPRELHPYVDECPRCGCVGPLAAWQDADRHGKNVWVHDPLGAELAMTGTVSERRLAEIPGLLPAGLAAEHLTLETDQVHGIGIDAPRLDLVTVPSDVGRRAT